MSVRKRRKRSGGGEVIHVAFGPNGGHRIHDTNAQPTPPSVQAVEPITNLFSTPQAARLVGLTVGRLRWLDRSGIAPPTGKRQGRRAYSFRDLIVLRTIQELVANRVRVRDITGAIQALRGSLPRVAHPLSELRIVSDGKRIIARSKVGAFEPLTGQMILDLEVKSFHDTVVHALRTKTQQEHSKKAYELYLKATLLDEDPNTLPEAEALYRKAIELDPLLAIAYTNLGNIKFRKGDEPTAVELYRMSLGVDPTQPEAQYNLGYVLLDRGEFPEAVRYLQGAVTSDGGFADAHFYLAMAYESLGDHHRAVPAWQRYLELEPTGTWADIARQHLLMRGLTAPYAPVGRYPFAP